MYTHTHTHTHTLASASYIYSTVGTQIQPSNNIYRIVAKLHPTCNNSKFQYFVTFLGSWLFSTPVTITQNYCRLFYDKLYLIVVAYSDNIIVMLIVIMWNFCLSRTCFSHHGYHVNIVLRAITFSHQCTTVAVCSAIAATCLTMKNSIQVVIIQVVIMVDDYCQMCRTILQFFQYLKCMCLEITKMYI